MNYTKILVLSSLLLSMTSCLKDDVIIPSKQLVKEERTFADYTSVETSDGIDLVLTMADAERVEVEASDNVIDHITIRKVGNKLIIEQSDRVAIWGKKDAIVFVSLKEVTAIEASGGADITTTNTLTTSKLSVELSGGCDIEGSIECQELTADDSGGGDWDLSGSADDFVLDMSGGGDFEGFDFVTKHFITDLSGGCEVDITVLEQLDVTASGGSEVNYKGQGTVNTRNLSGGSKINRIN